MSETLNNTNHLDDSALAAIVDGDSTQVAAIAHLSACEDCRRRLSAVALLVDDPAIRTEVEALEADRAQFRIPKRWRPASIAVIGTLAAAAVAALVIGLPNRSVKSSASPQADSIYREGALTTTAPPRIISPPATASRNDALRWTTVPGADIYRVQVWNTDGSVVFSTDTRDTTAALPPELNKSGATYLWEVKARTGWDRWVSSEFLEFTIR
jgi:hypothetical protein